MKIKVNHIKNQLSSYDYWVNELFHVDDQLIEVRRMIEEPRVTQYSDKPMIQGSSDSQHNQFQSSLMHEEKLINKRSEIEKSLFTCVSVISKCEAQAQEMIYAKFIKNMQDNVISLSHNYSRRSMYRRIDKELTLAVIDDTLCA